MCGIIGKISLKEPILSDKFILQRDIMYSRGPDDSGIYIDDDRKIAFGYRRLSIVDLSEKGNQPFVNENNTVFLVCNGEIYNAPELRKKLTESGHVFKSFSDNEVILHGYEEWGEKIIIMLEGMFAFGIWDSGMKKMIVARDRFGIKPLYYEHTGGGFSFASSLKSLTKFSSTPREISIEAVCDYLTYRYVPSPKTIYKGISKLEPAHFLAVDKDCNITLTKYWEPAYMPAEISKQQAKEQTLYYLQQAIKKHLISDVPIGNFLSSGYDSTALSFLMKQQNYDPLVFSIGFENWDGSEHALAGRTAKKLNLQHYFKILNSEDFIPEGLIAALDEPIADISVIPTYHISKLASQYVKTVFSGDGADELFGGYDWYKTAVEKWQKMSFFKKMFTDSGPTAMETYKQYMSMGTYDVEELKKLLKPEYHSHIPENTYWLYEKHYKKELPLLKSLQYLDLKTFLPELILTKLDRASMANSLEVRVPFLDVQLFEFIYNLRPECYFSLSEQKPLLADIIEPIAQWVIKKKKTGFVGPNSYYEQMDFYSKILKESCLVNVGIFEKKYIGCLITVKDIWRIWKIVILELWLKENTD